MILEAFFLIMSAQTAPLIDLYRGSRSKAMGGAYVALADDEQALFLNPAGLATYKGAGVFLPGSAEMTSDIVEFGTDVAGEFSSSFDVSSFNTLIGKNIYGRAQFAPAMVMTNLGFGALMDAQTALFAENQAFGTFELGYQTTNGFQVGLGWTVLGDRMPHRRHQLNVGIGAKMLWRRGGYNQLSAFDLINMSDSSYRADLIGDYQIGIGADLGAQYRIPLTREQRLSFGTAYTEIGDIHFGRGGTSPQKGKFSVGAAYTYKPSFWFEFAAAYDFSHITRSIDWRRKNHLGFEFKFPILTLMAGINQMYYTLGVTTDLWLFRISGITYGEEFASLATQNPSRLYLLSIDLVFNL